MDKAETKKLWQRTLISTIAMIIVYALVYMSFGRIPMTANTFKTNFGLIPIPFSVSRGYDLIFLFIGILILARLSLTNIWKINNYLKIKNNSFFTILALASFLALIFGIIFCAIDGIIIGTAVIFVILVEGLIVYLADLILYINFKKRQKRL